MLCMKELFDCCNDNEKYDYRQTPEALFLVEFSATRTFLDIPFPCQIRYEIFSFHSRRSSLLPWSTFRKSKDAVSIGQPIFFCVLKDILNHTNGILSGVSVVRVPFSKHHYIADHKVPIVPPKFEVFLKGKIFRKNFEFMDFYRFTHKSWIFIIFNCATIKEPSAFQSGYTIFAWGFRYRTGKVLAGMASTPPAIVVKAQIIHHSTSIQNLSDRPFI